MDVRWPSDLDPAGVEISGDAELAQRLVHRIQTRRRSLLSDPSYGIDIAGYLGQPVALATVQADVLAETRREPGAENAQVVVTQATSERIDVTVRVAAVELAVSDTNLPPARLFSVSPATGPTAGGTTVEISGTRLTGATAVYFGATPATALVVVSDTLLRCAAPAGTGAVTISAATPSGPASLTAAYTYAAAVPAPTVSAVSPARPSIFGGTALTVTGANFTGATGVSLGGTPCTSVVVVSPTQITCVAPAKAAGSYALDVTTASGTGSLASSVVVTDPAAVALSVYQRADNFTGSAWPGIASAGTSGPSAPAFSMYGTPTTTTAPSGRPAGRCGAGLAAAAAFKFGTLGDFFSAGAGTLVLAHRVQGASTNLGSPADGAIFADVAGFARITSSSPSLSIRSEIDSGGVAVTSAPSGWHTYTLRWNQSASKYEVRINRGTWSSVTKTSALSLVSVLYMGLNPVNGNYLDWSVAIIMAAKTPLVDATCSDLEQAAADYAGITI